MNMDRDFLARTPAVAQLLNLLLVENFGNVTP